MIIQLEDGNVGGTDDKKFRRRTKDVRSRLDRFNQHLVLFIVVFRKGNGCPLLLAVSETGLHDNLDRRNRLAVTSIHLRRMSRKKVTTGHFERRRGLKEGNELVLLNVLLVREPLEKAETVCRLRLLSPRVDFCRCRELTKESQRA